MLKLLFEVCEIPPALLSESFDPRKLRQAEGGLNVCGFEVVPNVTVGVLVVIARR
jgi:hypothetical protein